MIIGDKDAPLSRFFSLTRLIDDHGKLVGSRPEDKAGEFSSMSGYLRPTPRSEANSRASSVFDFPQREYTGGSNITPDDRNQVNTLGYSSKNYTGTQRNYSIKSYLVISGGTGCNTICSAFPQARTCYVLPVTDDGGSSSEIIRVIGMFAN